MKNKYTIKKIKNTKDSSALFFNTIQKRYRKYDSEYIQDSEKVLHKIDENDKTIIYKYNSLGFRSDNFTKNHDGLHLLFSGCSETEGLGGNLDSLWSWMVYKEFSNSQKVSGFYNLSRAGWGWQTIISNIIEYINQYGKPDNIFIMFPNIGRNIKWLGTESNEEEIYYQEMLLPYLVSIKDDPFHRKSIDIDFHRKIIVDFILIIKLFEEYCKLNNIKLFWSTWDKADHDNYLKLGVFDNFVELKETNETFVNDYPREFYSLKKDRKDWLRKRDGHHGYLSHFLWSKNFLNVVV